MSAKATERFNQVYDGLKEEVEKGRKAAQDIDKLLGNALTQADLQMSKVKAKVNDWFESFKNKHLST